MLCANLLYQVKMTIFFIAKNDVSCFTYISVWNDNNLGIRNIQLCVFCIKQLRKLLMTNYMMRLCSKIDPGSDNIGFDECRILNEILCMLCNHFNFTILSRIFIHWNTLQYIPSYSWKFNVLNLIVVKQLMGVAYQK